MESQDRSDFHLDDDDRVPLSTRRRVRERMQAAALEDTQRASKRAVAVDRVVRSARKDVQVAIGPRRFQEYAEALAQRRERLRVELEAARDAGMSADQLSKLAVRRRRESTRILKRVGIDPRRLARIARTAEKRIEKLCEPPRRRGARPGRVVLPDRVPADIIAMKTNPWTIVSPPYPGWWWWNDYFNYDGFKMTYTSYTSPASGMAGVSTFISNYSPGDIDIARFDHTTSVGFWYKTPKAGLIEVWIKGQCAKARHTCWLDDEWGVSSSTVRQKNFYTLRVWDDGASSWGGFSQALLSHFYEENHTDGYWNIQWLTSGGTYWGHLFSDLSYPKNKWVWISVGTRNWNYTFLNDVEVESTLDTRWFIEQVFVESTG